MSHPIRKMVTYVPVSQELIDDCVAWLPIWLSHELNCELTMRMFGETWYRGRGELDLLELGRVPRYDSTIWEDE